MLINKYLILLICVSVHLFQRCFNDVLIMNETIFSVVYKYIIKEPTSGLHISDGYYRIIFE